MNSRFAKKSQKGTGTKMAEKLNNFEKFERKKKKRERKKIKFQPSSQNLEKQVKPCYLVRGCPI